MATRRYEMTINVLVDEDLLAEHEGDRTPPPNEVAEWYGGDLVAAITAGLAEVEHAQIEAVNDLGLEA